MRLHEHEKVVEAIRQALLRVKPGKSDRELLGEAYARAALDAMLEAAAKLGVGKEAQLKFGGARYYAPEANALILRLEAPPEPQLSEKK